MVARWLRLCGVLLALQAAAQEPTVIPDAPDPGEATTTQPASKPTAPTLSGMWFGSFRPGESEYLEVFAERRFIWRTSQGVSTSGDLDVQDRVLVFTAQNVRRVFVYELTRDTLRLTPDANDRPVPFGPLAKMTPLGARQVTWLRQGRTRGDDAFAPTAVADLAGTFQAARAGGLTDELTFTTDGRFRYRGPGGLAADGTCTLADGVLNLSHPPVLRRLVPRLMFNGRRWRLFLRRHDSDRCRPANDLADLPPAGEYEVVYARPTEPVKPELFRGAYECRLGKRVHRLEFGAPGAVTYRLDSAPPLSCRWRLTGLSLTISHTDGDRELAARVFLVQPLGDGLVLLHVDGGWYGPTRVLDPLPPTEQTAAVFRPVVSPKE